MSWFSQLLSDLKEAFAPDPPQPQAANRSATATSQLTSKPDPVELVRHASAIPGAAGAMLSMQDGLCVAKQLPEGLNGDTLAAFIPDIFGRIGLYTKDLKLGEVSGVVVDLGNRHLHIAKGGKLYLCALSKTDDNVPADKFATLASHLAQLNK